MKSFPCATQQRSALLATRIATGTLLFSTTLITGLLPRDAQAQALEEIVVTASRRSENLQDVGATVTAFTTEAMAMRSIENLTDIDMFTPGLNVANYQTETSFFIRGIGTPAIIAGNDNSVATYVDGVFLSRAAAIGPAFFDVERLEVLRGPQGTLYGRNATGGAVNIVTKRPTDTLEADLRASYGNYDAVRVSSAIGGPITESVRARVALQYDNRSGYTDLVRPAGSELGKEDDVEDRDSIALRARLELDLSSAATLGLSADYYHQDDQASVFHYASAGYADEIPGWYQSREGSATAAYFAFKSGARVTQPESRTVFSDVDYSNKATIWGFTAQLDWTIRDHDLTIIANTKQTQPELQNEFDLSDAFINVYQREEDHTQNSIDFQLSSPKDQRFGWILGGYYFEEENDITNNIFGDFWEPILTQGLLDLQTAGVIPQFPVNIPQTTLCCDLHLNGEQESEAWSVFLDTEFALSERLVIKLGGRYSEEERDGRQDFELTVQSPTGGPDTRFAPNALLFPNAVSDSRDGVQPDPFGLVVAPVEGPASFDEFTPALGLDYQLNDDMLLYLSAQKGFKSGGYNIGSSQREPFKPETIWGYEAGIKSTLLDGRLVLNGAAFHYDYDNLQAQDSVQNQPIIRNVGKAEVDGAEIETWFSLSDSIQLDAAVTYLDARFTEGSLSEPLRPAPLDQAPGTFVRDLNGLSLPRAPEWKYHLGAQGTWSLPDMGQLTLRADYGWQSKIYFTVFNINAASQDAYGQFNARLQYTHASGSWDVALFGRNLSDESYFSNQILTGSFYGSEFVGSLGAPRTYGLELHIVL
tara:strand:- start:98738 stop:101185 length:2448 start_codon:yes stop_codon:yes gene_type:complete